MTDRARVEDLIEEAAAKLPTLSPEQVQYLASIMTPDIWLKEIDQ